MRNRDGTKERLLLIGIHTAGSGLTSVGVNLLAALAGDYVVGYLGVERPDGRQRVGSLPPAPFATTLASRGVRMLLDGNQLDAVLGEFEPDIVLVVGPPFLVRPLLDQMQHHQPLRRIVLYAAIEAELTDPIVLDVLGAADSVLTYCDFARESIFALAARARRVSALPPVHTIGHGVAARDRFKLLEQRSDREAMRRIRARAFPDEPRLHGDDFLILNANRVYARKRHDLTVRGFAQFARNTGAETQLYLHTLFITEDERAAIVNLAAEEGVANRVHLSAGVERARPRSDEELNLLYNACDVGLNTAMGEGFGLVSFEHALTEAPQIIPDHTGLREYWDGAAELVPTETRHSIFYEYGEMCAVSPGGVAEALQRLHGNFAHRTKMGLAARARAASDKYSWNKVSARLVQALS
jgi:glycosyltransferase involved in cell wall biosynthesis